MDFGRRTRVGLFAAVVLAAAGGCAAKPYARDPLLRDNRGVRGDRTAAARPLPPPAEPAGPDAPTGPLLGATPLGGLTSR